MHPIRVLLADDNTTFRHGLRKLLESDTRLQVVGEAGDGLAVVELALRCNPDVVLMDICMPGQDGLAAARQVRECRPGTQVVILTSYDTPAYREAAREVGASAYLLKSVDVEELLEAIVSVKTPSPAGLEQVLLI